MTHLKSLSTGICLAVSAFLSAANADQTEEFFHSKPLTVLVGSDAGGGYDSYARVIARYWPKYIPGNPSITIKLMPGAGGVQMQNFLANQAPRDGSVIGATRAIFLVEPLLNGTQYSQYDPRKMNWIGNVSSQQTGCFVLRGSRIKTIQDAMNQEVTMALTSVISNGSMMARVFNDLLGTRFRVVPGYSSSDTYLAIERGEADGSCLSYSTVVVAAPRLIKEDRVNFLVLMAQQRMSQLPDVPVMSELLHRPEDADVVKLIVASITMGRPYVAPEGVPEDRLEALRSSFMNVMKDPEFLAQAANEQLIVEPSDHREIENLVEQSYKLPSTIVERTRRLLDSAAK